jgi:UrcA family protein
MSTFIAARVAGRRAKFGLLLLGGLAGIMAAGAAGAATPGNDVPAVVVKYSDQSLATQDGVNQLYRRLMAAARQVCPDAPIRDLGAMKQVEQCRNEAVARAIRQIDNPQLAALYASHSKNG